MIAFVRDCTIRYDTIRYNTIWYGTIRYDTIRCDAIRYITIQYDRIRMIRFIIDSWKHVMNFTNFYFTGTRLRRFAQFGSSWNKSFCQKPPDWCRFRIRLSPTVDWTQCLHHSHAKYGDHPYITSAYFWPLLDSTHDLPLTCSWHQKNETTNSPILNSRI